jgi:hypothetical protein
MRNGNIHFKVNGNPIYIFLLQKILYTFSQIRRFSHKKSKSIHRKIMLEDDYRGGVTRNLDKR